jgi:hypothetical protein
MLKEDYEIQTRIAKAWSILGAMKHFFKCKDVNLRAKVLLNIRGPITALLSYSWCISVAGQPDQHPAGRGMRKAF